MRWPQKALAPVISSPVLSTTQQRAEFDCLCQQPAELTFGREGVAASDFVSHVLIFRRRLCFMDGTAATLIYVEPNG